MKVLQWSMTIPSNKKLEFLKWFDEQAGPILGGFGAKGHEICVVEEKEIVGKQKTEKNSFIERIYFDNDFNIPDYFEQVKNNPKAWEISRQYEKKFGAKNIELRVLHKK